MSGWRSTSAYQRWARTVIDNSNGICALCGRPVDLTLPGTNKWGPTADHIIPRIEGGAELDPRNGQLAHRTCNITKENLRRKYGQANPSRKW